MSDALDTAEGQSVLDLPDDAFEDFEPTFVDEDETEDESGEASDESEGEVDSDQDDELESDDRDEDGDGDEEDPDSDESGDDESDDTDDDSDDKESDEPVDFKTFYERVTSEFKANGRSMKVASPDDVVQLMQMGANYNHKMAALKPNLKLLKMLEKNDLLSEDKLSFYIDLEKKDPAAIAKLVADSNIDPLDLDLKDVNYKASNHSVDDREMALDEVVSEIKDTETYDKTIRVVLDEWDVSSKQAVADDPQLLKAINEQMASGVYDLISNELQQERVFGRLDGKSDIEAYQFVGQKLAKDGAFDHLLPSQKQGQQEQPNLSDKADTQKLEKETQRRKKRRSARPTKSTPSAKSRNDDYNPLGMSDDDFEKEFDAKFL